MRRTPAAGAAAARLAPALDEMGRETPEPEEGVNATVWESGVTSPLRDTGGVSIVGSLGPGVGGICRVSSLSSLMAGIGDYVNGDRSGSRRLGARVSRVLPLVVDRARFGPLWDVVIRAKRLAVLSRVTHDAGRPAKQGHPASVVTYGRA